MMTGCNDSCSGSCSSCSSSSAAAPSDGVMKVELDAGGTPITDLSERRSMRQKRLAKKKRDRIFMIVLIAAVIAVAVL